MKSSDSKGGTLIAKLLADGLGKTLLHAISHMGTATVVAVSGSVATVQVQEHDIDLRHDIEVQYHKHESTMKLYSASSPALSTQSMAQLALTRIPFARYANANERVFENAPPSLSNTPSRPSSPSIPSMSIGGLHSPFVTVARSPLTSRRPSSTSPSPSHPSDAPAPVLPSSSLTPLNSSNDRPTSDAVIASDSTSTGPSLSSPLSPSRISSISDIRTNDELICILHDQLVDCLGNDSEGQLGNDANLVDSDVFVSVSSVSNVVAIDSKGSHSCALIRDGTVSCWGENREGEVSVGGPEIIPTPMSVANMSGASAIALGKDVSCALISGEVRCWGKDAPVGSIQGITDAVSISSSDTELCAILSNRKVMCYPFGIGRATSLVTNAKNAETLHSGRAHHCLVATNNKISCWGEGTHGQLGLGAWATVTTATEVTTTKHNANVVLGNDHTCAFHTDGSLSCWGENADGQLGLGDVLSRNTATSLSDASYIAVAAGGNQSCAVPNDHMLVCWGQTPLGFFSTPHAIPLP